MNTEKSPIENKNLDTINQLKLLIESNQSDKDYELNLKAFMESKVSCLDANDKLYIFFYLTTLMSSHIFFKKPFDIMVDYLGKDSEVKEILKKSLFNSMSLFLTHKYEFLLKKFYDVFYHDLKMIAIKNDDNDFVNILMNAINGPTLWTNMEDRLSKPNEFVSILLSKPIKFNVLQVIKNILSRKYIYSDTSERYKYLDKMFELFLDNFSQFNSIELNSNGLNLEKFIEGTILFSYNGLHDFCKIEKSLNVEVSKNRFIYFNLLKIDTFKGFLERDDIQENLKEIILCGYERASLSDFKNTLNQLSGFINNDDLLTLNELSKNRIPDNGENKSYLVKWIKSSKEKNNIKKIKLKF